jgi:hypothetical protein
VKDEKASSWWTRFQDRESFYAHLREKEADRMQSEKVKVAYASTTDASASKWRRVPSRQNGET